MNNFYNFSKNRVVLIIIFKLENNFYVLLFIRNVDC